MALTTTQNLRISTICSALNSADVFIMRQRDKAVNLEITMEDVENSELIDSLIESCASNSIAVLQQAIDEIENII